MKTKGKRVNGKMVPWINTRYARHYKARQAMARVAAAQIVIQGQARIQAIMASGPNPAKAVGIAECTLSTYEAVKAAFDVITLNGARVGLV